ncbi:App1 family protein [Rothia sp. ZJ932]|uniref:App1 family protein n=1 Tax=Rothia sp. ZJ932 TaxID=2810516 RepID=UPI0019671F04|nr:phosphatase domain-containing protein [Rothia sp. ZJ932]QRZ62430.1 DUF2183 domain-containing protein [Rothia sp. ZJ932]
MNTHPIQTAAHKADNIAYRIGTRIHRWRENRARDKGLEEVMVANPGYGSTSWIRIIGRALYKTDGFEEIIDSMVHNDTAQGAIRGWRSFSSIAISHAPVTVTIDGNTIYYLTTNKGGVLDEKIAVQLEPGIHTITLQTQRSQPAETEVFIVPDNQKIGILSDVDDTVMVTALPRPMLAAWNSFVVDEHARIPTPGMAVLMERLTKAHPTAPIMYLSTGAWNVSPTLTRFLSRNGYPKGTFLLTDWGPTPTRWFRSGADHKVRELTRLAQEFPQMKWILIGDDGQRDPDIYNGFAVRYPQNVAAILIRNLTTGETILSKTTRVWADNRAKEITHGDLWEEANDGATFSQALKEKDLL